LWEVRANLINKFGWTTGNQLVLQIVTDGMKLSPANPTFLQARDAIIQADFVANAGANRNEIWAGFAKRGMGAACPMDAVRLASLNPARAVGLDDRGEIATDKRADLVRVRLAEEAPLVRAVWREGERVV